MSVDRIVPKLWMGSQPTKPLPAGMFDLVVLAAAEVQPPRDWFHQARVLRVKLDDGVLSREEAEAAGVAAKAVADEVRKDRRALVTCNMGVNRSGLIVALALKELGMSGKKAVEAVRSRRRAPRGMVPLSNPSFVEHVLG